MKCRLRKYAVVTPSGAVTYGFRCGPHKVYTKRYSTAELRDERAQEHKLEHKKGAKKS